jgi:O-antigen/teichoic acid export membrane protein|tara:strand:+ start:2350 stop:3597 length:1248 start_codon:yes stop_codon:yes gene_type:complete
LKKNILFLFSFLIAKGITFLVPILLADILTKNDFGMLEYALAGVGMLLNSIISLGVPGAYPYFILRKKEKNIEEGFSLHPLWLLFTFLLNLLFYHSFNFYGIEIYMAVNISYIIAVQKFYSTILKSQEKINKAVLLEAGIYVILFSFLLGYFFNLIQPNIFNISKAILSYAMLWVFCSLYKFYKVNKNQIFIKYKKIISFSIHLLLSSSFLFLLTVSGRILSKYFFDYESAGIYGFYFRLAAIVVLIYQVISVRYFKDLYTKSTSKLDFYFSSFYLFIFTLSILLYFLSLYIMPYFSNYFKETYSENRIVFFILFCQMTMWISSALNSSIVDREGLAKVNNWYFLGLLILFVMVLYLNRDYLTLLSLSFILYSLFFIANITQFLTLRTKKIIFKKSFISLTFVYIASCILLILMH